MKKILFTILFLSMLANFTFPQHEVTIGYRRVTFFNPGNPGSFSLQIGNIKVKTSASETEYRFNNFLEPDSMFTPMSDIYKYLESDIIDLPKGKSTISFEWKFSSLNISNVLRSDSILKIEHQIYDIDLGKVIAVPLILKVGNETPVYDTSAGRFRKEFIKYGTRTFELNSSNERQVVFRIKINPDELLSSRKIKCYSENTSISYDDTSEYLSDNPFAKVKLPHEVSNINLYASDSPSIPKNFILYQNYPDPFNPTTEVRYSIPSESWVILRVYNLIGQMIAELVNGDQSAGDYSYTFDGSNLPSGIYLEVFQARSLENSQSVNLVRKMVLMK